MVLAPEKLLPAKSGVQNTLRLPYKKIKPLAARGRKSCFSIRQPPMRFKLSDVVASSAQVPPSSEGHCIPRFQLYRMSAQTDRLLVWRSIGCDAPDPTHAQYAGVENVSRSFRAHRKSFWLGSPRSRNSGRESILVIGVWASERDVKASATVALLAPRF